MTQFRNTRLQSWHHVASQSDLHLKKSLSSFGNNNNPIARFAACYLSNQVALRGRSDGRAVELIHSIQRRCIAGIALIRSNFTTSSSQKDTQTRNGVSLRHTDTEARDYL